MKNLNLMRGMIGTALLGFVLVFSGCNKCKDVTCLNGGSCDEETGECVCATGYSGADCGVEDPNHKFNGSFTFTGVCQPQVLNVSYAVTLSPRPGTQNEVIVTGLTGNASYVCYATVNSNGTSLTIDRQFFEGNSIEMVEASSFDFSSNLSSGNLTFRIYWQSASTPDTECSGTLSN